MPKMSEFVFIAAFAVWVFVVLPFMYQEPAEHTEFWSAKLTDWLLAASTVALALFTWRLYRATAGMWSATQELRNFAEEQSRDMKASIAVAQRAAEAAKSSADTAEKSFTLLERPYVIPDHVVGLRAEIYFGNISGSASFRIGNYGKVPAIVHRVGASFSMIEIPVTQEKLREPNYGPGQGISSSWSLSTVLGEGATHHMPSFYIPHGMRNVEIEHADGRARPKTVAQHEFFLSVSVEYEDAASGVMRVGVTLWKYGLEGFERYGGKKFNYEHVVGGT